MTYDEDDRMTKEKIETTFGKRDFKYSPLFYQDIQEQKPEYYTYREFNEFVLKPTIVMKVSSFFRKLLSMRIPTLEDIFYVMYSPLMYSGDIDGDFEYKCHCKCDLKECDYTCAEYFFIQDWKPYRDVDFNLPSIKDIPVEKKIKSYLHFQRMLSKRNRNPYFALYYYLRTREFNKLLNNKKK
jgi:hypothetical protein